MENHVSITREPDDKKNKTSPFQRRILQSISNPSYKSTEVIRQKKSGMGIPEWQLVDFRPDKIKKQEESNSYVTDWQMTS